MKIEIISKNQVKKMLDKSLREIKTEITRLKDKIKCLEQQNKELRFIENAPPSKLRASREIFFPEVVITFAAVTLMSVYPIKVPELGLITQTWDSFSSSLLVDT